MIITPAPLTAPTWPRAIASPAVEFAPTPLRHITGQIPTGLQGTLYRNGPGRLERGGQPVGHWFDGDGAILAVTFRDGQAIATYRYVQTAGYQQETQAGRLLFGNYGMSAPGPLWQHWRYPLKNAANTSVLALPDQLLALWEAGKPHTLDLATLATHGETDLQGGLQSGFSAHPKVDPQTGEIYNFGVELGPQTYLHLYRCDRQGRVQRHTRQPLRGVPFIHDFVLAGRYLVFCVPPLKINLLPVVLGLKTYAESMQWRPNQGTQLIIVDRDRLDIVAQAPVEPWFQWHFANGFETAAGQLAIDVIQYADFATNQRLQEVATGRTHTPAPSQLQRLWLQPSTGRIITQTTLVARDCEFPVVAPADVGTNALVTYLVTHRDDVEPTQELYGAIARYDHTQDCLTVADLGRDRYPTEPIYAPDAIDPDQGWLLTVVFDGTQAQSEVWIYPSDAITNEPIARLALPHIIPPSFHGTWAPARTA